MKTEKSRLKRSFAKMKMVLRRDRHKPLQEQKAMINVLLDGHYRYYGVSGNIKAVNHFYYFTLKYWRKMLGSRSQNGKLSWTWYNHILKLFPLRKPKLYMPYTAIRSFAAL